ncbi:MAG TPA: hypothetical protein VEH83_05080 [Gemmatimonadales bacterium]|nr:hypothetical protein [Gemmatimonadales bacterium]
MRTANMIRPFSPLLLAAGLALACRREAAPAASERPPSFNQDTTLGVAAPDSAAQAAARFVQAFYQWYERAGERYEVAVRDSPAYFAPALLGALRLDYAASQASPSEVVGLDWDPFLDTQDPCNPYQVTGTTRRGDTVLVAVNGMCTDRPPQTQPDVLAEVRLVDKRWVFVDFRHVADAGSLVQDLQRLQEAREPAPTRVGH